MQSGGCGRESGDRKGASGRWLCDAVESRKSLSCSVVGRNTRRRPKESLWGPDLALVWWLYSRCRRRRDCRWEIGIDFWSTQKESKSHVDTRLPRPCPRCAGPLFCGCPIRFIGLIKCLPQRNKTAKTRLDSTTWPWIVLEWLEGGKCLPLFTPPAIAPEPDCYRFSAKVYLQFRQLRDISRPFGPLLQPWHIKQWLRAAI